MVGPANRPKSTWARAEGADVTTRRRTPTDARSAVRCTVRVVPITTSCRGEIIPYRHMKDAIDLTSLRACCKALRLRTGRLWILLPGALLHVCAPAGTEAQESDGSTAAAVAGGALGLASGATLGAVGSIIPCSQTGPGPTCVRWSAIGGGAIGVTGGALLGAGDSDRLADAAVGAGIGFVAGVLIASSYSSSARSYRPASRYTKLR